MLDFYVLSIQSLITESPFTNLNTFFNAYEVCKNRLLESMTNVPAVATAAFIHVVLRMTIFIEPNYKACSPLTPISSWLFLFSILEIIWDTQFIPERYKILPLWWLWCVEVLTGVLCMEFGSIVVWCNLEKLIYRVHKSVLMVAVPKIEDYTGDITAECVAILTATCVLYYVSHGTDSYYQLNKRFARMSKKLKSSGKPSSLKPCPYLHLKRDAIGPDREDGLELFGGSGSRRSTRITNRCKKRFHSEH